MLEFKRKGDHVIAFSFFGIGKRQNEIYFIKIILFDLIKSPAKRA